MNIFEDFAVIGEPSPLTEDEIRAIETYYAFEYPADLRGLLAEVGPGSFDDVINVLVPKAVPGLRAFGEFSGFFVLDEHPQVDEARREWERFGFPVLMSDATAATSAVFPWGSVESEIDCCWRPGTNSTRPVIAVPSTYPDAGVELDVSIEGFVRGYLVNRTIDEEMLGPPPEVDDHAYRTWSG